MSADLSGPIRAAIIADGGVTAELTAYKGSYPVFTRRPVPTDAPYPLVVVSSGIQDDEQDGLNDQRPVLVRDVLVYGRWEATSNDAANYRQVETVAYALQQLFHRQRGAIVVPGWSVVDIVAMGPSPAPDDDEQIVARMIELTVKLARQ